MTSFNLGNNNKNDVPDEGIRRLSASASLIMIALVGGLDQEQISLSSPEIRVTPTGDIQAWLMCKNGYSDELFKLWPNKFAQLAFGFACDHFKMLYPKYWIFVSEQASHDGADFILGVNTFDFGPEIKLKTAQPERVTAPALMEMCKRMATTPGWLMKALDDLEKGDVMSNCEKKSVAQKSGCGR